MAKIETMKTIILGAGITGLSMARLLQNAHQEVIILEKEATIGGIAKTKQIEGTTYHPVGGHCFNSKHPDVMAFIFKILPPDQWHKITRCSKIDLNSYEVDYPIEFSIQQIYHHDKELAYNIVEDFLSTNDNGQYSNLEDWFRKKFGNTLSELYFIPYNTKIWGREPREMSSTWVETKLPIPNKKAFIDGLLTPMRDTMPHSWFYYPNSNNQATLINALADQLTIKTNTAAKSIERHNGKWLINGEYEADLLISTIPLNILPSLIKQTPDVILNAAKKLQYNKVSNVLWESQPTNKTWSYHPLKSTIFHRYIHIGNFFSPTQNYTITEAIGERSYEEMVEYGKRDPFLITPIDYNISEHAYVVYDENRDQAVATIQNYLKQIGLISIGRFGQWEYFNMDVCMKQAINTYNELSQRTNDCIFD